MSVCSASSRPLRLVSLLALLALVLPAVGDAAARDSGRFVRRIKVDDHGIVIDERVRRDTLRFGGAGDADRHDKDISIEVDHDGGDDVVRVFDDAVVGAGDHVRGSVVTVFGSIDVEGTVDQDVVAVMGSVRIHPGAEVGGEVVSVGGALEQAPGATVRGESVSVGFLPLHWEWPAVPVMIMFIVTGWLASVAFGWLLALLSPTRFVRVAATASRRTMASLLIGLISIPCSFLALVLLLVTVIGIPFALVLPPTMVMLTYAGQLAATYLLGCKLTGRRLGEGRDLMLPLIAGTVVVGACFVAAAFLFAMPGFGRPAALFFGLLGFLLLFCLNTIGTGAVFLSRFGGDPRDVVWGGADPIPAPPPFTREPDASPTA